ncbi:glycerol dehydratase reactivase beta/small subunit family protein [Calorimonas adulescens]|jgi:hypothetical protein|uniref:Propanediol dehydratase n=1 Tax=Calorimonas adulescens TaxID=2606906 RepID=A0A5D8QES6_9THEO|nr:glycerol dehydratase reactivase beta/small subunit family protein [Calorimonas adulescens]TZE83001.1 propanediol dehydratase [Calorimonas adulescens]
MGNNGNVSIFVIVKEPEQALLKELLAGIEEEGIPYTVSSFEGEALNETFKASQLSKLGVAVGVWKNRIILHYSKSRGFGPLFDGELNGYEKERARRIGNNAARLYKVMPLKDMRPNITIKEIVDMVRERVIAALKAKPL